MPKTKSRKARMLRFNHARYWRSLSVGTSPGAMLMPEAAIALAFVASSARRERSQLSPSRANHSGRLCAPSDGPPHAERIGASHAISVLNTWKLRQTITPTGVDANVA